MKTQLGYLIVRRDFYQYPNEIHISGYRGIDRQPMTVGELTPLPQGHEEEKAIEKLKLRKEISAQMEKNENDDGFLTDFASALKYYHAIKAISPDVELLFCFRIDELPHEKISENGTVPNDFALLGYDVAYKSEDFFSAIRHGLLGNLHAKMRTHFESLNRFKLFDSPELAKAFMDEYLLDPGSESGDFIIYELHLYKN